jgi:[ribosomal protein S5]-alanine N-acetyltransferase
MQELQVRTPRLFIRPMREEDRSKFVKFYEKSWGEMAPWFPLRASGETFEQTFEKTLAKAKKGEADSREFRLVGFTRDDELVAFFSLMQIVRGAFESGVASWCVHSEHTRQGMCTEGVMGVLDLAFAATPAGLGLHRVQANVIPVNTASVRVAEKAGFRREGLGRNYLKINGEWRDHVFFAKLSGEHSIRYL